MTCDPRDRTVKHVGAQTLSNQLLQRLGPSKLLPTSVLFPPFCCSPHISSNLICPWQTPAAGERTNARSRRPLSHTNLQRSLPHASPSDSRARGTGDIGHLAVAAQGLGRPLDLAAAALTGPPGLAAAACPTRCGLAAIGSLTRRDLAAATHPARPNLAAARLRVSPTQNIDGRSINISGLWEGRGGLWGARNVAVGPLGPPTGPETAFQFLRRYILAGTLSGGGRRLARGVSRGGCRRVYAGLGPISVAGGTAEASVWPGGEGRRRRGGTVPYGAHAKWWRRRSAVWRTSLLPPRFLETMWPHSHRR